MYERRDFLKAAAGGLATAALAGSTRGLAQSTAPPEAFDWGHLTEMARTRAKGPYKAAAADLPAPFSNLNFEDYISIRRKADTFIWEKEKTGFALEPLHRGYLFGPPMQINLVENGLSQRLGYQPGDYEFGRVPPPGSGTDIGFSGFRVHVAAE